MSVRAASRSCRTVSAFGSAVVVLLWFYLSVIALVVGGFVNAELERHAGAPGRAGAPADGRQRRHLCRCRDRAVRASAALADAYAAAWPRLRRLSPAANRTM